MQSPSQSSPPAPRSLRSRLRAPGDGQVLVRVQASSLNGFDIAVANGMLVGMMEHRYPVVLGKDFAGVVETVGTGSDRFAVGDAVFGVVMTPYLGEGAHAEYLAVSDQYGIARIPKGVDVASAGALGLAGAAALGVLDALDLQPGTTVLVVGATGGVGSIVTQYAAAAGARVIATAQPGGGRLRPRPRSHRHRQPPGRPRRPGHGARAGRCRRDRAPRRRPERVGRSARAHRPPRLHPRLRRRAALVRRRGYGQPRHRHPRAPGPRVADGWLRVTITTTVELADVPAAVAAFPQGTLGKQAVRLG